MRTRFKSFSTVARGSVVLLLAGLLLVAPLPQTSTASANSNANNLSHQDSPIPEQLVPNKPVERKLRGGEAHVYEINLPARHFLRLGLEQLGIDVALTLFDGHGSKLIEVNQRHGERGSEKASLVG